MYENDTYSLGVSSMIGTRMEQQDSVYAEADRGGGMAIVCDGMGGLSSGALASQMAMQTFAEDYDSRNLTLSIPDFLTQEARKMDETVFALRNRNPQPVHAGTTVAAIIVEGNQLHWLTVGDSRVYIIRNEAILTMNRDHNYRLRLDVALEKGEITLEKYRQEENKAAALISYIGMGNVSLMDVNTTPFLLEKGDIVLLCSDGLYNTLSNQDILRICKNCREDMQLLADTLTKTAVVSSLENQDNTSVVLVRYDGKEADFDSE